jgi:hypothetical protein
MTAPEPISPSSPPPLSPDSNRKSGSLKQLFSILLSLFLVLFLTDAIISLADDSLILFFGANFLSGIRLIVGLFSVLASVLIYILIGLTPLIPKRLFVPLTLFSPLTILTTFPLLIYFFRHIALIGWSISLCQILLGLLILGLLQGGFKIRWPMVPENQLGIRGFSWWNLSGFVLVNIFVLPPAVGVYLFLCASMAVNHFTDGFMALRPNGFTVQVTKYVRSDGKTIELFPMAHVADAGFYKQVSQTFPTNSIILMEGVTDVNNLLTNKLSYKRMARSLGLSEQKKEFVPSRGEVVRADVDVGIFTPDTIELLNLVTLIHSKGLNSDTIHNLLQFSPTPHVEEELFDDLLRKRNAHLLGEIQSHLLESENIMVPWGVAHMPGISKEIQKSGFRLDQTQEYMVIRFRGFGR